MRLRPTPDALRERAFAVLGERVVGCRFLDLYAGTGAVSLEALSRGARCVVLVESHRGAGRLIYGNLEAFEVREPEARLVQRPALRAVAELSRRGLIFDLAWADPPFERWQEGLEALAAAFQGGAVAADGLACLECPERADPGLIPDPLRLLRDLSGGASRLWMLGRRGVV
jgi:16S rRNA (guanine966-N2)-methyltransferase